MLSDAQGRIPFAIRIGVTGHRSIPDTGVFRDRVRQALNLIRSLLPTDAATPVRTVVVSALAEGADRLVVDEVLDEADARLEGALPLPPDDYMNDFASEQSKAAFRSLLARTSETWQAMPSASREEAYERAGRYVVDRADAVIALWDGEPSRGRGGTAEIVAYAKERGVPLVWVCTAGTYAIDDALLHTPRARVVADAANELGKYNAKTIRPARLAAQVAVQRGYWGVAANPRASSDLDRLPRSEIAAQVLPLFVRADLRALRTQWWFLRLSAANFMMAAAAVLVVVVQTTFFPALEWIVGLEIVFLGLLIFIPLLNRRWWRFHDRWISYRFLAERLRSSYFLTLAGTGDRRERSTKLAYFSDPEDLWIERALEEATIGLPRTPVAAADVQPLREYLSRYWIGDQMRYHEKTSRIDGSRETALILLTATLFGFSVAAAFMHVVRVEAQLGALSLAALLLVVSISVPAIGAAVHGVGTQRQFRRHSERYARMARLLRQLRDEMDQAGTMEEIGRIAADTERIMREENSDWFGVMRFHDMELIT